MIQQYQECTTYHEKEIESDFIIEILTNAGDGI